MIWKDNKNSVYSVYTIKKRGGVVYMGRKGGSKEVVVQKSTSDQFTHQDGWVKVRMISITKFCLKTG